MAGIKHPYHKVVAKPGQRRSKAGFTPYSSRNEAGSSW